MIERKIDGRVDINSVAEKIAWLEVRSSLTAEEAIRVLDLAAKIKDLGFNPIEILRSDTALLGVDIDGV